jgi:hypothetical protein
MSSKHNKNNSTMVKNINGTSSPRYAIDNLSSKFVNHGGTSSSTCQVKQCSNSATATGHVKKTDARSDDNWHLTKLCAHHNHSSNDSEMALRKNAKLIPVRSVNNS